MRYVYRRTDTGELVELIMTVAEKEARERDGRIVLDGGVEAVRDYSAEHAGDIRYTERPIESDALGCHPSQAEEFEAEARKLGVPVRFDRRTGCALFESRRHRNQYIKALNRDSGYAIHDRDGGYSDP
ncbi:MAG TPA: hypothetical protein PLX83_19265 [bacterium]|nr:hypothetical protein [bacterium]